MGGSVPSIHRPPSQGRPRCHALLRSSLQPTLEQHVSHGKGDRGLQRQALNTEQKKPEDDRMAKKKKAAEFHSRVEAIRNSVKAVNERIDKIKQSNDGLHF